MKKLPDEKDLKDLAKMAKNFEAQMREQSETARKIAMKYKEALNKKQKHQAQ